MPVIARVFYSEFLQIIHPEECISTCNELREEDEIIEKTM